MMPLQRTREFQGVKKKAYSDWKGKSTRCGKGTSWISGSMLEGLLSFYADNDLKTASHPGSWRFTAAMPTFFLTTSDSTPASKARITIMWLMRPVLISGLIQFCKGLQAALHAFDQKCRYILCNHALWLYIIWTEFCKVCRAQIQIAVSTCPDQLLPVLLSLWWTVKYKIEGILNYLTSSCSGWKPQQTFIACQG